MFMGLLYKQNSILVNSDPTMGMCKNKCMAPTYKQKEEYASTYGSVSGCRHNMLLLVLLLFVFL